MRSHTYHFTFHNTPRSQTCFGDAISLKSITISRESSAESGAGIERDLSRCSHIHPVRDRWKAFSFQVKYPVAKHQVEHCLRPWMTPGSTLRHAAAEGRMEHLRRAGASPLQQLQQPLGDHPEDVSYQTSTCHIACIAMTSPLT